MCPNTTSLISEGYYGTSGPFKYVKVRISRCTEDSLIGEPEDVDEVTNHPLNQCFPEDEMYKMLNIVLMNSHVDFS